MLCFITYQENNLVLISVAELTSVKADILSSQIPLCVYFACVPEDGKDGRCLPIVGFSASAIAGLAFCIFPVGGLFL